MTKRKDVQTAQFQVMEADGYTHTITEITEYMQTESLDGPGEWIEGMKRYEVSNRGYANRISDTEFLMVSSGRKAKRI